MIGILRPRCLFASEAEGRRHANEMNPRKKKTHGISLLHKGWMARKVSLLPPVEGEVFFLTSPFIERCNQPENRIFWCAYRCCSHRYCLLTGLIVQHNLRNS